MTIAQSYCVSFQLAHNKTKSLSGMELGTGKWQAHMSVALGTCHSQVHK